MNCPLTRWRVVRPGTVVGNSAPTRKRLLAALIGALAVANATASVGLAEATGNNNVRPLTVNQTEGYVDGQNQVFTYAQNFHCMVEAFDDLDGLGRQGDGIPAAVDPEETLLPKCIAGQTRGGAESMTVPAGNPVDSSRTLLVIMPTSDAVGTSASPRSTPCAQARPAAARAATSRRTSGCSSPTSRCRVTRWRPTTPCTPVIDTEPIVRSARLSGQPVTCRMLVTQPTTHQYGLSALGSNGGGVLPASTSRAAASGSCRTVHSQTRTTCQPGGAGEQAVEGVGVVAGWFHGVGELTEGGLDPVTPLGDDLL